MHNTTHHAFRTIQLNINSLISHYKRTELQTFLNRHQPHAMLICETVLNSQHNVAFKNYNVERQDKKPNQPERGTAILIKKSLDYIRINTISWNLESLEATAVLVPAQPHPLVLVSVYTDNTKHH